MIIEQIGLYILGSSVIILVGILILVFQIYLITKNKLKYMEYFKMHHQS